MIFLDNNAKAPLRPHFFEGPEVREAIGMITIYLKTGDAERRQTDVPTLWKMPLDQSVLGALSIWSSGRCAFCEAARQDLMPYRFRPPGYAEPIETANGKDSYLALCFAWSNFFPICPDCRPNNPADFPVTGARARFSHTRDPGLDLDEKPVLLYPGGIAQPLRTFRISPSGRLIGLNAKAQHTIKHFNLNAGQLGARRADNLRSLIEAIDSHVLRPQPKWAELFEEEEFGGIRYLYLRRLMKTLEKQESLPSLRNNRLADLQRALIEWGKRVDLTEALQVVAEQLTREDQVGADEQREPAATRSRRAFSASRLKSVSIHNFKSLEELSFELPEALASDIVPSPSSLDGAVTEAPCLLILGENATGKSSILEAIALACFRHSDIDALDLKPDDVRLNPRYLGSGNSIAEVSESLVSLTFHDGGGRNLVIDGRSHAAMPFRIEAIGTSAPLIFAYGAHRRYGQMERIDRERHFDTLFRHDKQLSNPEPWLRQLAKADEPSLNEVVSALRYIIKIDGEFETITFESRETGAPPVGTIRVRKQRSSGTVSIVSQPLELASSGYRAILALVCDVLKGLMEAGECDARTARLSSAIVLIDEIEAHLHPRWKLGVIAGLRRALPRATFIITSHDPLCLHGMFNGEVIALNRYFNADGEGRGLDERVEQVGSFSNIEAMTIEQLLTSDLFQLLSADNSRTEHKYAQMADILSREGEGLPWDEADALARFRADIGGALPFGRSDVSTLVQEAVADYLRERRHLKTKDLNHARERAKEAVKNHLRTLLS